MRSRLKIRSWTLRELFGIESITESDTVVSYEWSRVLINELNTSGMDFTEAVNKFVINLLMPGSKSLISLKQLQMEYEEYFSIQKGTSESRFREKCIKKMLDRIASRLIINEIDLKEYNQKDFSYSEMENIIVKDLDIFNPNFKRKPSKVDEKEKEDKNKEEKSPVRDQKAEQNTKEKEEPVVKDTIEYIMDGREYIELEGLTDLLCKFYFHYI